MTSPSLVLTLLGTLVVTSYQSLPSQTDSSPHITSIGEHVHPYGVAVSQDLLCPLAHGKNRNHSRRTCPYITYLHYGDWLFIPGQGLRVINDCMNKRMNKHIDLWVNSYQEERRIGTQHQLVYFVGGIEPS